MCARFVNLQIQTFFPRLIMTNNNLEMLTAREQLMEDIDCIIDEYFQEYGITNDPELVKVLCDAVIKNFPTN